MRKIGFDTQVLTDEARKIREESEIARKMITNAYKAIEELDAYWEGQAKDTFKVQFASDRETMLELCEVVDEIADAMTDSQIDYGKCEEEVKEMIQELN